MGFEIGMGMEIQRWSELGSLFLCVNSNPIIQPLFPLFCTTFIFHTSQAKPSQAKMRAKDPHLYGRAAHFIRTENSKAKYGRNRSQRASFLVISHNPQTACLITLVTGPVCEHH